MNTNATKSKNFNEELFNLRRKFQSLPNDKKSEFIQEFPFPEDQMIVGWSIWNFTKFQKRT